jgi:lipoprotein NlpD
LRPSRSIWALGLCCLLLGGCADTAVDGQEFYVVRAEDTLYSIAWRHDLDFRDLARWNNLGADFRISVGQVLVLGPRGVPAAPVNKTARAPDAPHPNRASAPSRPAAASQSGAPSQSGAASQSGVANQSGAPSQSGVSSQPVTPHGPAIPGTVENGQKWAWPTDRVGSPQPVPGGGILLSGRLGQDVRAASTGRVVYTGSGIRGYGNLIIIKHGESLLSAYAHNREMLVHDGQNVAMGQVIAHMGEGPNQAPILYFEIRQNGRPIDPVPFFSNAR